MRKQLILNCAKAIFSAYRSDQYVDHDGFVTQLAVVLEQYPDEVIRHVSHPVTGIQHQSKWPPSIAEVVEACEAHKGYLERKHERLRVNSPLGDFAAVMRQHVSEGDFWSWFSQMRFVNQGPEFIRLAVRSPFFRDEIRKRFERQILEAANAKHLILMVDPSLQDINRGPAPFDKDGNRR